MNCTRSCVQNEAFVWSSYEPQGKTAAEISNFSCVDVKYHAEQNVKSAVIRSASTVRYCVYVRRTVILMFVSLYTTQILVVVLFWPGDSRGFVT